MSDQYGLNFDATEGRRLKKEGIDRVESHNERFVDLVRRRAAVIAQQHGQVTVDNLRVWAAGRGLSPHHPNAWGAVFKGSRWQRIGTCNSTWPASHARMISIWQLR